MIGERVIVLRTSIWPRSMRLAMVTSPSRVSSGTVPISRRYMRTGSLVFSSIPDTIAATDSAGTQSQSATSINIRAAGPDLVLLAGSVSFARQPAHRTTASPDRRRAISRKSRSRSVTPLLPSQPASVTGDGVTPGYLSFSLTSAALSLPVGTSTATVTLTCTSTACAGKTQSLAVSLRQPARRHPRPS